MRRCSTAGSPHGGSVYGHLLLSDGDDYMLQMGVRKRGFNSEYPCWGLEELHSRMTALLIEVSVVIRFDF